MLVEKETLYELDKLQEKWGKKYPTVLQFWRNKWENLTVYFQYPEDIRRVIYTTNIIESVHRQFRTLTKTLACCYERSEVKKGFSK